MKLIKDVEEVCWILYKKKVIIEISFGAYASKHLKPFLIFLMCLCEISLVGLFFSVSFSKHVILLIFLQIWRNVKNNFPGKEREQDCQRQSSCNMWES